LEAHETKGVNHVDYYPHSDKPYLLTTSDDVRYLTIVMVTAANSTTSAQ
jgi:hypothetical protein